ncbi:hypothetical protein LTV02_13155 [Nocardia yamanashiensis]|uniref:hypothetical protein n=1 Tax=Nocardia yamanashiensis TaxID=209247 RepID=UPI001E287BEA|nr:hypothetical protein [Nocardia yamanashiensis]UGT44277.1 hypothetical protein LTV02_13155 [Nocardia yamanashiensis]
MGNIFSAQSVGLKVYLANGGTDVFCDVMALAGSGVARTPWQQNLVLHFCDMARYARGVSGFDLAELPWTSDHRREQEFFLAILDRARQRTGWDRLHYIPAIDDRLEAFAQMVGAFDAREMTGSDFGDWTRAPKPHHVEQCVRHGVFQGEFLCRLCDPMLQPIDAPRVWELTSTRMDGDVLIHREIRQIPDEVEARVLEVVGAPEPGHVAVKVESTVLERVSVIIEAPLDDRDDHWLSRAVA